jgi:phosphoribulokinase
MSRSYPIISITGSSGAGTTSVKKTFENIFRREKVAAAYVEGDAFHRHNRMESARKWLRRPSAAISISPFQPGTNLFEEREIPATASPGPEPSGTMSTIMKRLGLRRRSRHLHRMTPLPEKWICCSMKVCMALRDRKGQYREHADLKIGVVPK